MSEYFKCFNVWHFKFMFYYIQVYLLDHYSYWIEMHDETAKFLSVVVGVVESRTGTVTSRRKKAVLSKLMYSLLFLFPNNNFVRSFSWMQKRYHTTKYPKLCSVLYVIFSSVCDFSCQFSILFNSPYLQTLNHEVFTLIELNIQEIIFTLLLLISLLFQYCDSTTRIFLIQLYLNMWRSVLWYIHLILRQQFSVPTHETCSSLAVACACSFGCCIHIMNCKFRLNPFPIETSTLQTNKQKVNEKKKTQTDKSIGKTHSQNKHANKIQ
jgi:hypothetical protein